MLGWFRICNYLEIPLALVVYFKLIVHIPTGTFLPMLPTGVRRGQHKMFVCGSDKIASSLPMRPTGERPWAPEITNFLIQL